MPTKHSTRAEQRKRLNLLAKQQGISLGDLQEKLKKLKPCTGDDGTAKPMAYFEVDE